MMIRLFSWIALFLATNAWAAHEYLVRVNDISSAAIQAFEDRHGGEMELVSEEGALFKWTTEDRIQTRSFHDEDVVYIQKNKTIHLLRNPSLDALTSQQLEELYNELKDEPRDPAYPDNPSIKPPSVQANGSDPELSKAWGISKIGALAAFSKYPQGREIIVAVTDTGVDYNHKDLLNSMWRNPNEIPDDGIDNDGNGYVDDIVGWDFASNDNKPYDLSLSIMDILFQGGNPGHGTHVAGVIGAQLNNSEGIAGVAPQAKIMAMRFITEKGQGSLDAAIKAIDYAVNNGAHIINASWGGEKDSEPDSALQDAINRAKNKGVIFVAAAGNGRAGAGGKPAGFNNDTDSKPMVPASYNYDNMVSVAAIDSSDALAAFSNFGSVSVKVGAPGVKVLSTVPGDRYQDTILSLGSMNVTWDGTSMAAPHVAGALAVIWSTDPSGLDWQGVRQQLLSTTVSLSSLSGKVATGGRIHLK